MIRLTTQTIARAADKARTAKPFVKMIEFRKYEVRNKQTGATYAVTFDKRGSDKFAACTCKAGAKGLVCYHAAAAVAHHVVIAAMMIR